MMQTTITNSIPTDRFAASSGKYPMRRIAGKILLASLIWIAILLFIVFLGWLWGHTHVWSGLEFDYIFWKSVEKNAPVLGLFIFILGEFCIIAWYFRRMSAHFEAVINAMEQILPEDSSWITLPDELTETASRMNHIKTQLQQSRMQAKEAEQRKNDLVVYLAHDLKTPLTSVLGYLSILEESPDLSPKQRAQYLAIAHRKADRLEELINEFFEITRFNLTSVELEESRVDFSLLLQQTVFEFRPMLEQKHLACALDAPDNITLYCDPDKIQRVVDNLLRNACHYAYENTEIGLALRQTDQGGVLLTCSNQGPTIPAGKLERIFEQFYRLDNARTSSTGGAGLGLAIARQIAQLHGGSIRAESVDEITTFTLELPGNFKNS